MITAMLTDRDTRRAIGLVDLFNTPTVGSNVEITWAGRSLGETSSGPMMSYTVTAVTQPVDGRYNFDLEVVRKMSAPTPERPVGDVELPDEIAQSPIEFFEIRMKLDTTLTVNQTNWMKPGVEGAIRFRSLPSDDQLKDAATFIQFAVIDPAIQEMIRLLSQQLAEQQSQSRGGR